MSATLMVRLLFLNAPLNPAPDYHESFDEIIYGLEGLASYTVDGKAIELGKGDNIFIPRGVVHGFQNNTDSTIRFLCRVTPGVFGPQYFREIAEILNVDGPPDMGKMKETLRRHGLVPVVPA